MLLVVYFHQLLCTESLCILTSSWVLIIHWYILSRYCKPVKMFRLTERAKTTRLTKQFNLKISLESNDFLVLKLNRVHCSLLQLLLLSDILLRIEFCQTRLKMMALILGSAQLVSHTHSVFLIQNFVYFEQQMGAAHCIPWLKKTFLPFYFFSASCFWCKMGKNNAKIIHPNAGPTLNCNLNMFFLTIFTRCLTSITVRCVLDAEWSLLTQLRNGIWAGMEFSIPYKVLFHTVLCIKMIQKEEKAFLTRDHHAQHPSTGWKMQHKMFLFSAFCHLILFWIVLHATSGAIHNLRYKLSPNSSPLLPSPWVSPSMI